MSIQDLSNLIKAGHGELRNDPQSGSIIKLLGENGFASKIEAGSTTGHTYTIIHKPPSSEFLLVDAWHDGQSERKAYHAFSIRSVPSPQSNLSTQPLSNPLLQGEEAEHPMVTYLKQLNDDADKLLNQIQKYA